MLRTLSHFTNFGRSHTDMQTKSALPPEKPSPFWLYFAMLAVPAMSISTSTTGFTFSSQLLGFFIPH